MGFRWNFHEDVDVADAVPSRIFLHQKKKEDRETVRETGGKGARSCPRHSVTRSAGWQAKRWLASPRHNVWPPPKNRNRTHPR